MGCSVTELLERFSSTELVEWAAYERVTGPIGPGRDDLNAGNIAATIANVHRKKGTKAIQPQDMAIQWGRKPEQTPEEQLDIVRVLNAAFGGTDNTNREVD